MSMQGVPRQHQAARGKPTARSLIAGGACKSLGVDGPLNRAPSHL